MFEFPFLVSHINTTTFQASFAVLGCAKYNCLTVKQCFQVYLRNIGNFGFGAYFSVKNLRPFLLKVLFLYAARFVCPGLKFRDKLVIGIWSHLLVQSTNRNSLVKEVSILFLFWPFLQIYSLSEFSDSHLCPV